jgi:hypothetical protein
MWCAKLAKAQTPGVYLPSKVDHPASGISREVRGEINLNREGLSFISWYTFAGYEAHR